MRDERRKEERRKKEASKIKQTTRQSNMYIMYVCTYVLCKFNIITKRMNKSYNLNIKHVP